MSATDNGNGPTPAFSRPEPAFGRRRPEAPRASGPAAGAFDIEDALRTAVAIPLAAFPPVAAVRWTGPGNRVRIGSWRPGTVATMSQRRKN